MARFVPSEAGIVSLFTSGAMQEFLRGPAEKLKAQADAAIPPTNKKFDAPNHVATVKVLDKTAVGKVKAANPRSNWYARNRGTLKP